MKMKPIMTFCNATIKHFKTLINNDFNKNILIGVKGGGCNGLKYYIETSNKTPEKKDEIIIIDDLKIIICGKSLIHLLGSHIYWKHNEMGSRLEFDNPNARSKCGCGETFSF